MSARDDGATEMTVTAGLDCDDRSLWSTLGYDALAVIWGIDTDTLSEACKRRLATATIELRDRNPDALSSLQDEILGALSEQRLATLLRRIS
jgi:hypothetical protein